MAYIKVNHSKFGTAAQEIEDYVSAMKTKMQSATNEVNSLSSTWEGYDYIQFSAQWRKVSDNNSVYQNMVNNLDAYAKFLRYAGSCYKDAQINAINRAALLP